MHEDFAICCYHNGAKLYLYVDGNAVYAKQGCRPEFFHFLPTEDPGEFVIMNYKANRSKEDSDTLWNDFCLTHCYLKVKTTFGRNSGPLRFEESADEYYCRLKLRPRLYSETRQVTLHDFKYGEDAFYIRTASRKGFSSYLYLKDEGIDTRTNSNSGMDMGEKMKGTTHRYTTACKPSIKGGNFDELMLFRLEPFDYELTETYK